MGASEAPTAALAWKSFEAGAATRVMLGPASVSLARAAVYTAAHGSCHPGRESELLHQRRRERGCVRGRGRERGREREREREEGGEREGGRERP